VLKKAEDENATVTVTALGDDNVLLWIYNERIQVTSYFNFRLYEVHVMDCGVWSLKRGKSRSEKYEKK
jgi:hypothetical protein